MSAAVCCVGVADKGLGEQGDEGGGVQDVQEVGAGGCLAQQLDFLEDAAQRDHRHLQPLSHTLWSGALLSLKSSAKCTDEKCYRVATIGHAVYLVQPNMHKVQALTGLFDIRTCIIHTQCSDKQVFCNQFVNYHPIPSTIHVLHSCRVLN